MSESQNSDATVDAAADSLSAIFSELMSIYESLEGGGSTASVGDPIDRGLELCGRAQSIVGLLGLFSSNEQLDDVPTNELKYLLLPGIAGFLWSQRRTGGPAARPDSLVRCLGQLADFLRLAGLYGVPGAPRIGDAEVGEADEQKLAALVTEDSGDGRSMAQPDRAKKIERLRRRKELEKQLTELRPQVERPHVDEEDKRNFYLKLLERWVIVATEEAAAAKAELPLARMMASRGAEGQQQPPPQPPQPKSGRPPVGTFVLTRSALEARVFGAGYPSLPAYSVDEWIDAQIESGVFPSPEEAAAAAREAPAPVGGPTPESAAAERAARDAAEDADDPQALGRLRAWDDWKDFNRRGDGNRYRKG
ncbi:hypothetical protein BOX15_Mlig018017g2 [Macrostomum lignano]|uniref:Immunoglobulin-binding protein 1 n=2 Tax=Macrostomum lignano TaxID=282301 RepID=A0A267F529_9PLAT|nr:hypothetical protein BOX15_Mlig018017g2 [Macrostomum lignano]